MIWLENLVLVALLAGLVVLGGCVVTYQLGSGSVALDPQAVSSTPSESSSTSSQAPPLVPSSIQQVRR